MISIVLSSPYANPTCFSHSDTKNIIQILSEMDSAVEKTKPNLIVFVNHFSHIMKKLINNIKVIPIMEMAYKCSLSLNYKNY